VRYIFVLANEPRFSVSSLAGALAATSAIFDRQPAAATLYRHEQTNKALKRLPGANTL
jgi:hypothetical protein